MDERIKILIEKRKKLGWTVKHLAEKAGLSHGEALHVEKKGIYNHTYVSKLTKALNKAIKNHLQPELINTLDKAYEDKLKDHLQPELINTLDKVYEDKFKDQQDNKRNLALIKKIEEKRSSKKIHKSPTNKNEKWSKKYEKCIECGSTEIKHVARGLCRTCYDRNIELQLRSHKRKRGIAGQKLTKEYLIEEYITKEKSLLDIARECACSRQYVYKIMKYHDIPLRHKSSARSLALEKKKLKWKTTDEYGVERVTYAQQTDVDESFFASWSNEMAYVLGVIYTDGHLYHKPPLYSFSITQKEPELLNKVKTLMKCNAKLQFTERKVYEYGVRGEVYTLGINNLKIYADLLRLGLTPDKSLTIDFPNIPPEYVRHFIRGCWAGDGSVYIQKNSGNIYASYTSGLLNFIKGMLDELEKAGLKKRKIYTVKRKNPSYYFRFAGISQCKELYHYLYDYVSPEQFLQRKFDVFNNYLRERKIEIKQEEDVHSTQSDLISHMDKLDKMLTIKRITTDQVIDQFNQLLHLKKDNNNSE